MICYRDMTFCSFYRECKDGSGCSIALTDKVEADAKKWWGDNCENGPPIAIFADKPACFVNKEG